MFANLHALRKHNPQSLNVLWSGCNPCVWILMKCVKSGVNKTALQDCLACSWVPCLFKVCLQLYSWSQAHFIVNFFLSNSLPNLSAISVCCNSNCSLVITKIFCTYHGSWTAMACTEIDSDLMIREMPSYFYEFDWRVYSKMGLYVWELRANSGTLVTAETLYNTINFCWSTHKRHSIARPKGRGMGCLLWVQRATYCVDLSILSSTKYLLW